MSISSQFARRRAGLLVLAVLMLGAVLLACQLTNRLVSAPAPIGLAATATRAAPATTLPTQSKPPVAMPTSAATAPPGLPAPPDLPAPIELLAPALRPQALADAAALSGLSVYSLTLDIPAGCCDGDEVAFSGQAQVQVTNTEDVPLDRLYFRLLPNGERAYGAGRLDVETVTLNGAAIQTALSVEDTVLELLLPQPLAPGERALIGFDFNGQAPQDFGGSNPAGYGIFNYSDDVLTLSGWYPILAVYDGDGWNLNQTSNIGDSVYSDMALYQVDICLPATWIIAASGYEQGRRERADQSCAHVLTGPMRDFTLTASPSLQTATRTVDGVTVRSFYAPGNTEAGERALKIAVDALLVFERRFGAYPYNELDVVQAPMRYAQGVEYPGLILIAAELYAEPGGSAFEMTIAHEVAHQWWYNLVGNDVFDAPWLDEGLTTWSSLVYFEDQYGAGVADSILANWDKTQRALVERGRDERVVRSLAYFESNEREGSYGGVVYIKAANFFAALRVEIGDKAFFSALQSYFQARRYTIATADDLLSAFETAADRSLDDFYQTWLYTP